MTSGMRTPAVVAVLILAVSLPLAASEASSGPLPAAGAAVQPPAALAPAAAVCPAPGSAALLPRPEALATEVCGPCSDAICTGKQPGAVCGVGFRCLSEGRCAAAVLLLCKCLMI